MIKKIFKWLLIILGIILVFSLVREAFGLPNLSNPLSYLVRSYYINDPIFYCVLCKFVGY